MTFPSLSKTALGLFVITLILSGRAVADTYKQSHTMKLASPYSFSETLSRVHSTLTAKGMTVFATIDHQAGARDVGLHMPPTTVLVFGNPKAGTPLMQAAPDFALELPLRVLVREDADGHTVLVYDTAASLEGRHGLPAGMVERLAPAEKILTDALQTEASP